jgi:arginine repressor
MLQQEQQQAQANLVKSMQSQTQGDMAQLMARYGAQLTLAGGQPPAGMK